MLSSLAVKGVCILILFVETLLFGWLPIYLHHRGVLSRAASHGRKLVLDLLNCLTGGVFLGVCLLHLLVEGREDFEQYKKMVGFHSDFPFYEATVGVGLFLITLIEKVGFALLSFFRGRREQGGRSPPSPSSLNTTTTSRHSSSDDHSGSNSGSDHGGGSLVTGGRRRRDAREHAAPRDPSIFEANGGVPDYPPVTLASSSRRSTNYGAVRSPTTLLVGMGVGEEGDKSTRRQSSPTTERGKEASRSGRAASKVRAATESALETVPLLTRAASSERSPPTTRRAEAGEEAVVVVVVDPKGCQSLTASLDAAAVVVTAATSPAGGRPGEVEEEGEVVAGEAGIPGKEQQQQQEHHHHHTGLVASDACQPKDISEMRLMRALLLLLALSFHTVFDGLAVGLQESPAQVWGILAGIALHKAVVSFCLGLDLAHSIPPPPSPTPHPPDTITITLTAPTPTTTTPTTTLAPTRTRLCSQFRRPLILISLFSLITPVGVAVGMGVTDGHVDLAVQLLTSSVLQALATGTFLYVTFFEVLGQQFAHSHNESRQAHSSTTTAAAADDDDAGPRHSTCCTSQFLQDLGKVGAAVVGFACMAGVKLLADNV